MENTKKIMHISCKVLWKTISLFCALGWTVTSSQLRVTMD